MRQIAIASEARSTIALSFLLCLALICSVATEKASVRGSGNVHVGGFSLATEVGLRRIDDGKSVPVDSKEKNQADKFSLDTSSRSSGEGSGDVDPDEDYYEVSNESEYEDYEEYESEQDENDESNQNGRDTMGNEATPTPAPVGKPSSTTDSANPPVVNPTPTPTGNSVLDTTTDSASPPVEATPNVPDSTGEDNTGGEANTPAQDSTEGEANIPAPSLTNPGSDNNEQDVPNYGPMTATTPSGAEDTDTVLPGEMDAPTNSDSLTKTTIVSLSLELPITEEAFDAAAQVAFRKVVAELAGVEPERVTLRISSVGGRRRLMASIVVDVQIGVPSTQVDQATSKLSAENIERGLAESTVPALNRIQGITVIESASVEEAEPPVQPKEDESKVDPVREAAGQEAGFPIGLVAGVVGGAVALCLGLCCILRCRCHCHSDLDRALDVEAGGHTCLHIKSTGPNDVPTAVNSGLPYAELAGYPYAVPTATPVVPVGGKVPPKGHVVGHIVTPVPEAST